MFITRPKYVLMDVLITRGSNPREFAVVTVDFFIVRFKAGKKGLVVLEQEVFEK